VLAHPIGPLCITITGVEKQFICCERATSLPLPGSKLCSLGLPIMSGKLASLVDTALFV
jgi:hypothetical protein